MGKYLNIKEPLHHAYLVEGDESLLSEVTDFVESVSGQSVSGNPDVYLARFSKFDVDSARILREEHTKKALGEKKFFILNIAAATDEAASALLKTLEDTNPNVHFFIIVPNQNVVLPTIRSRCFIVTPERSGKSGEKTISRFLESSGSVRLKEVAAFLEGPEEEGEEEKALAGAASFVSALESELYSKHQTNPKFFESLERVREARKYLYDRGSTPRLLLEYLALTLPILK